MVVGDRRHKIVAIGPFKTFVGCCLILLCHSAIADSNNFLALSEYQKQDWQVEDGLPQSNIRAFAQAPGGPLLIATSSGLVSFDGSHFTPIKVDPNDEVANEPVNALLLSRSGDLWIGTDDRGIVVQRGRSTITVSEDAGLHQERVRGMVEDRSGTIWVATQNGIERIREGKIERLLLEPVSGDITTPFAEDGHGNMFIVTSSGLYLAKPSRVDPFQTNQRELGAVTAAYGDGRGNMWIGFSKGLLKLTAKPEGGYVEEVQNNVHGPVRVLLKDRDGYLWVGTHGHGLCRVSSHGVAHWSTSEGLPDDTVRSLFQDDEANLWIGTLSSGMSRWRRSPLIPFGEPEGFPASFAANALSDSRGDLWLGTWGAGLFRIKQGKLQREALPGSNSTNPIRALAEDKRGNIWIGTWFNGLYRYDGHSTQHFLIGTEIPGDAISAVLGDSQGKLWVGTYKGLICYSSGFPEKAKGEVFLPDKLITAIKEDRDGSIIVGTFSGLYVLKGSNVQAISRKDGLSNTFVLSVSVDSTGGVWVGTKAGGVDFIRGGSAVHLPPESGIPAYPVSSVLDDERGSLWLSTLRGLLRVPLDQMQALAEGKRRTVDAVLLGKEDGMRSSESGGASQPPAARAKDGTLWFATAKGFVHTSSFTQLFSTSPPKPFLESFSVDNVVTPATERLELAPGVSDLEFQFDAIRLANPHQLEFRYKLAGYDKDWMIPRGRHARYRHLPPGRYRFLVSAREAGMPWRDDVASVDVQQRPFFYQTLWFYALIAATLVAIVALVFRMRLAQIKARLGMIIEERNRIAREWHDTLMADFAAISWQLEATKERFADQTSEASSSLELARNMVRHCQAEARRIIWDLREEIEPAGSLSEVLSRELNAINGKQELAAHLHIKGEEASLPPASVHHLACICQEALTNAVRHAAPNTIDVTLEYQTARLVLTVKDNGRGFQLAHPPVFTNGHFGIAVMQERARKLGGSLRVQSSPGAGTEVLVDIPTQAAQK